MDANWFTLIFIYSQSKTRCLFYSFSLCASIFSRSNSNSDYGCCVSQISRTICCKRFVSIEILDKVKFLDFVSDEDLPSLYANALCYVLPSLYEGFGLPVLEAMKYKCPVITSDVSSLPEAGGDAVLYVDPTNVADIAEKISSLI